jgi:hypothetical protein
MSELKGMPHPPDRTRLGVSAVILRQKTPICQVTNRRTEASPYTEARFSVILALTNRGTSGLGVRVQTPLAPRFSVT